jgi:hypothetical protein
MPVILPSNRVNLARRLGDREGKAPVSRAGDDGGGAQIMSSASRELARIHNRIVGPNLETRQFPSHRWECIHVDLHTLFSTPLPAP